MNEGSPGYYAVIPADVRYDDQIPANAKLLYGEVSALIGADGFCYATNQYFAKVYGMTEDSISRLLSKLESAGYIIRELERDSTGQVVRRKLYLRSSTSGEHPLDNLSNTPRLKNREGIDKKVEETNASVINTPQSPPVGGGLPKVHRSRGPQCKSKADVLPERFEKFWKFYRAHTPAGSNAGNRQKAIRAWDKLAPSDQLVTKMAVALAVQVKSQAWISGIGVPHASTWINNRGWEDDWGSPGTSLSNSEDDPSSEEGAEWVS